MTDSQRDLRVTKTHRALLETMQEFLEKKSFQKITVNDICQHALVSRSTFYLHFEDKYQLMTFFLQNEREQLEASIRQNGVKASIRIALSVIKERKKTYRNIFDSELNSELMQMLIKFFREFISETLTESDKNAVESIGPIPILSAYYASGIAGTVMWWIDDDFSVPIDELAHYLYVLIDTPK